jgi:RNA polymerase sigma factor (sigma-70 family)
MTSFDDLITPEVYQVALNYADRLARRTRNGLEAVELVQEALTNIADHYEGQYEDIRDLGALLTTAIQNEYLMWLRTGREGWTPKSRYLATGSVSEYLDPVDENGTPCEAKGTVPRQLQTLPQTDRMIRGHDVETAILKLSPYDQRLVRVYMMTQADGVYQGASHEDLSIRQAADRLGVPKTTAHRHWQRIQRQLAVLLADYAPVERADKTSPAKSA